jgi:hypothetical protein
MAMAISIIAMAIRISCPRGIGRRRGLCCGVDDPAALAERQLPVETAAACGVGGVVVAAAVALPLADTIGDAPVNVAGVGGASRHINSRGPDFCRTTGVRKNEMTVMCRPQLSQRTRRKRQMTYGSLTAPYFELDFCVSDQLSADAGTSSFNNIGRQGPCGRGGANCAIYRVFSDRVGECFWRPGFEARYVKHNP